MDPTPEQLRRFHDDGFLVVENAIAPQELELLIKMAQEMIERPLDPKTKDWDWRKGEPLEKRAYRTLRDRGVTCWTAFHSVGPENGCMHFVRGGHKRLLQHRIPPDPDIVVCPIEAGSVTFHHSATPHMTTGNSSDCWRLVLTQHFRNPACKDLPEDNYAWRVRVNQR